MVRIWQCYGKKSTEAPYHPTQTLAMALFCATYRSYIVEKDEIVL